MPGTQVTKKPSAAPAVSLAGALPLFRMKSDAFCELPPSDTFKLELLDGEVIAMTKPRPAHQYFAFMLGMVIMSWAKPRKLGRILPDTLLKLDDDWTPAPDLVFVARKHLKRVKEKRIEGPVELAVEVLSPSNPEIDRETKFVAYARFGIRWYWLVDLKKRTLDEYELQDQVYGNPVTVPFAKPFAPRCFPGLMIDLASLEW